MLIRKGDLGAVPRSGRDLEILGPGDQTAVSDAGGLTQFGAYVETLEPGSRSSDRHWHEEEDEFLLMLEGEAVLVEEDGAHPVRAGDACAWAKGVANGHHLINRSDRPCRYLIVGTRVRDDIVHYPDLQRTLYIEGPRWRLTGADGKVLREGTQA